MENSKKSFHLGSKSRQESAKSTLGVFSFHAKAIKKLPISVNFRHEKIIIFFFAI
jgi:hypothetical protein